jgi:N-acetylglucosamine-6-phosphate deacetylase
MNVLHARLYSTGEPIEIRVQDRRIQSITPSMESPELWVAPSFFDVQINGCLGISFNSRTLQPEQVRVVVDICRQHGIGSLCPTVITGSFEAIEHGFQTLTRARHEDPIIAQRVPGYHLEGPYLSSEDGPRGAHPREHTRDPNWDEFRRWNDAAEGRILMVTVAPERPGALRFIEQLSVVGITVAIGHTAATPNQIREAILAGAKTSTHLGNGCHAMLPRHESYLWEQLGDDRLWASLITDGYHLPASLVRCISRIKTPARLLLTCDASSLAGQPPGRYREWGSEFEVLDDGKVVVPGTPFLAGSGHFTDRCVSQFLRMTGLSLEDGINLASLQPRRLLNQPIRPIAVGELAELMTFDWQMGGDIVIRDVV